LRGAGGGLGFRGTRLAECVLIGTIARNLLRDPCVDVAERVHAQLGKLGIDATVQRVAVDSDVWHRVRIGPIKDLAQLNRLRQQLHASDLDSLVIRVDQ